MKDAEYASFHAILIPPQRLPCVLPFMHSHSGRSAWSRHSASRAPARWISACCFQLPSPFGDSFSFIQLVNPLFHKYLSLNYLLLTNAYLLGKCTRWQGWVQRCKDQEAPSLEQRCQPQNEKVNALVSRTSPSSEILALQGLVQHQHCSLIQGWIGLQAPGLKEGIHHLSPATRSLRPGYWYFGPGWQHQWLSLTLV